MTNPSEQKPVVAPTPQPQQEQGTPAPQPQQGDKPGEKPAQQS